MHTFRMSVLNYSSRALFLDEYAKGFGEWRIVISTRAQGDLRGLRRRDKNHFEIVIKKIRELSNGHFSGDNQKRLNGPNVDFPVFEAKMTRDSRLVVYITFFIECKVLGLTLPP